MVIADDHLMYKLSLDGTKGDVILDLSKVNSKVKGKANAICHINCCTYSV